MGCERRVEARLAGRREQGAGAGYGYGYGYGTLNHRGAADPHALTPSPHGGDD